jgi:hypothetical protein
VQVKKSSLCRHLLPWTALGRCGQGAGREQRPDLCAVLKFEVISSKTPKNRLFVMKIKY